MKIKQRKVFVWDVYKKIIENLMLEIKNAGDGKRNLPVNIPFKHHMMHNTSYINKELL